MAALNHSPFNWNFEIGQLINPDLTAFGSHFCGNSTVKKKSECALSEPGLNSVHGHGDGGARGMRILVHCKNAASQC